MNLQQTDRDALLIRCKRESCGQVLAHWVSPERTELEIDISRVRIDADGRPTVICPGCLCRNRLPVRARAMA